MNFEFISSKITRATDFLRELEYVLERRAVKGIHKNNFLFSAAYNCVQFRELRTDEVNVERSGPQAT